MSEIDILYINNKIIQNFEEEKKKLEEYKKKLSEIQESLCLDLRQNIRETLLDKEKN